MEMEHGKEYIASLKHWKDMYNNPAYNGAWKSVDRVPIRKIKIEKSLLAYPNEVDNQEVQYMLANFDSTVWIPVLVNQNFNLLDGQHRLAVAKRMHLKYIDVIVEDRELLENPPKILKSKLAALNI
jgi:hypothetical protein